MSALDHVLAIVPIVVSVASLAANLVAPSSLVGRVVYWLACNGPAIQGAVKAAADAAKASEGDGRPPNSGGL